MLESEKYAQTYQETHAEDETQKTETGHKKMSEKKEIESR